MAFLEEEGFTKAAENVVEVIKIIIAFFQHGFVSIGDVDLFVGVCHCAGAERNMEHRLILLYQSMQIIKKDPHQ